jgi:hypothetical protein
VLLAGAIPVGLVVLDFASAKRAIVEFSGIKVDLSGGARVAAPAMRMPDNIGISGNVVPDSTPMQIVDALQTKESVAVVDLERGDAWWVTRLLALSAGGERAGKPSVIVFIGREGATDRQFLGYAPPGAVVRALTRQEDAYRTAYSESKHIAVQVQLLAKHAPHGIVADPIVQRYLNDARYIDLGEAVFEQILMDQLLAIEHAPPPGVYPTYPPGPKQPDRLTLSRLRELLEPELIRVAMDLDEPDSDVREFLRLGLPYVALTRNGTYESVVPREAIESLVLQRLLGDR